MAVVASPLPAGSSSLLESPAQEPQQIFTERSSLTLQSAEASLAKSAEPVEQPSQTVASGASADIEFVAKADPYFALDATKVRQIEHGLDGSAARKFVDECEFISLGSYCGPSSAIAALGLRKSAYPFDWCRSPVEGIIHCFDNHFVDFLTFSGYRQENGHEGYLSTRWGGSFWHHKPEDPKVRDDFVRRIERMLGRGSLSPSKPRVFVRAVNSTRELDMTAKLYEALQRAMPEATIYLLIMIDMQDTKGPLRIAGGSDKLLFYRIHKALWQPPTDIHKCDAPYGEAIAFGIHYWSGKQSARAEAMEVEGFGHLQGCCTQFSGGCAATELMAPRPFMGLPISLSKPAAANSSSQPKPSATVHARSIDKCQPLHKGQQDQYESNARSRPSASNTLESNTPPVRHAAVHRPSPSHVPWVPDVASYRHAPAPAPGVPDVDALSRTYGHSEARHDLSRSCHSLHQPHGNPEQQPQFQDIVLPDDVKPGDFVYATAFSRRVRLQVPHDVCSSHLLRLQYMNGAISFAAAATTVAAVVAASATIANAGVTEAAADVRKPQNGSWFRQHDLRSQST